MTVPLSSRAAAVFGSIGAALGFCASTGPAPRAQDRISSAHTETRQITQPLDREIQSIAGGGATAWLAYRTASVPNTRPSCNAPVLLEPAKEMIVLVRVAGASVERLRTFAPSCEIDAGDMPLIWLDGVTPDASATWLTTLAQSAAVAAGRNGSLAQSALAALELTPGAVALRSLVTLAKDDGRPTVRSRALNALALRAEQEATATIQGAIANDPDTGVKKTAVGALARMPKDEGVPLLIQIARTNRNVEVRKQAMFWLGESKDPRAISFFEEILSK